MKCLSLTLAGVVTAIALMAAGCGTSAAPPTPTAAPAPPKATAPLPTAAKPAATAAQPAPTAAPAKPAATTVAPSPAPAKISYPEKGKSISYIVPWSAGASVDLASRLLMSQMEKDLGVPIQITNKAGANSVIGLTEMVKSKPDGYSLAMTAMPTTAITYLDPTLSATYGRKDFAPVAHWGYEPVVAVVNKDSPYKTAKDLIDAAKAKPGSIKVATAGLKSSTHMAMAFWAKEAGVQFSYVHFNGGAEALTAVLGGHVDSYGSTIGIAVPQHKSGELRVLGTMTAQPSSLMPDVKTLESQGWKVRWATYFAFSAPAGTPKEVVDILAASAKKATETDEMKQKVAQMSGTIQFMGPAEYGAFWDETETQMKSLLPTLEKQ